jgi:hypothetical protein
MVRPVSNALHLSMEIADDSATLYVSGTLCAGDAFSLSRACGELPERVLTLRLDLHGVTHMEEDAMLAVRGVLRYWRETRGGSFRLSFATERLIATYSEGRFISEQFGARVERTPVAAASESLTAMYL